MHRSLRIPDALGAWITAEADRRGKPHTFSSVAVEALQRGAVVMNLHHGAVEAAPADEGIASESQPGASRANDSRVHADAHSTPAPPRAARPDHDAAMARQRKLNAGKKGKGKR